MVRIKNGASRPLIAGISLQFVFAAMLFLPIGVTLSFPANAAEAKQKKVKVNKPYERWKWFYEQRAYPTGEIPAGANTRALKQIKEAKVKESKSARSRTLNAAVSISNASLSAIAGDRWIPIGPNPIDSGPYIGDVSGRVSDIEVDRANPNHWFVAVALGGVWETWDAGVTWVAKTDNEATQSIGAIAMAPSNPSIIYAGTGDPAFVSNTVGEGVYHTGEGLLKSQDGGNTWSLLATANFSKASFSEIRVHPTQPNTLMAAAANSSLVGVMKSSDGGLTWRTTLPGSANDLEVDPTNFNNQYAAMWRNGIHRSTDAGEAWSLVSGPWSNLGVGRIEMAIAPSNPNVMYVSIENAATSQLLGVWRSDNAWATSPTWVSVVTGGGTYGPQWFYNHDIVVDPANPLIAYFGGTDIWRINGNTVSPSLGGYGAASKRTRSNCAHTSARSKRGPIVRK